MGKIEESIMQNYKKALNQGNLNQARRSVELAKILKHMIEFNSFTDYDQLAKTTSNMIGDVFKPFSYKYNPVSGIVIIFHSTINLTFTENRLFNLLSEKETYEGFINIIKREEIKYSVWPGKKVTDNAVRILVRRLRYKIEPNPLVPQILLNYNKKGYVFVAKKDS